MTRILIASLPAWAILGVAFFMLTTPVLAACSTVSWYGTESGNRTADGSHFDGTSMTAAHRSLPFGTKLRVTSGGKSVTVKVNDRGPAAWTGHGLDLSKRAFSKLAHTDRGVIRACWERLR